MGDTEKKARLSGESPRISEPNATLPTVGVATEKPEPPTAALHPAVYVMYASLGYKIKAKLTYCCSSWISLSSSVILFNKYLLDTMGFSMCIADPLWFHRANVLQNIVRPTSKCCATPFMSSDFSNRPNSMAPGVSYVHD